MTYKEFHEKQTGLSNWAIVGDDWDEAIDRIFSSLEAYVEYKLKEHDNEKEYIAYERRLEGWED